ncbi:hypothetical protein LDENG_00108140 [Lucifuga dentata]|nr:hypothetical protein LDENG_00108140 [Lucifuga dentata]
MIIFEQILIALSRFCSFINSMFFLLFIKLILIPPIFCHLTSPAYFNQFKPFKVQVVQKIQDIIAMSFCINISYIF